MRIEQLARIKKISKPNKKKPCKMPDPFLNLWMLQNENKALPETAPTCHCQLKRMPVCVWHSVTSRTKRMAAIQFLWFKFPLYPLKFSIPRENERQKKLSNFAKLESFSHTHKKRHLAFTWPGPHLLITHIIIYITVF